MYKTTKKLLNRSMRIRGILVDLDDTVWDFEKTLSKAHTAFIGSLRGQGHDRLAQRLGDRGRNAAEIAEIVRNEYADGRCIDYTVIRKNFHKVVIEETRSEICHEFLTSEWTKLRSVSACFFPGAEETLRNFRSQGMVVGAVTNGNADVVGNFNLFDFQVSPATAAAHKPQRAIYLKAAEKAEIENMSEILFVGDNFENDVQGPKAVGMRTCYVVGSRKISEAEREVADFVVNDITELREIVKNINSSLFIFCVFQVDGCSLLWQGSSPW